MQCIVDLGTPGFIIEREIAMVGGRRTYGLVFENLRGLEHQLLGKLGHGITPTQLRLTVRCLQDGRLVHGNLASRWRCRATTRQRVTFGTRLADLQAIQWWVADAAPKLTG
jgi:alkylation response protein AidB-like acyl-CoA dehydrogenase